MGAGLENTNKHNNPYMGMPSIEMVVAQFGSESCNN